MLSRRLFLRRAAVAPLLVPSAVTVLASLATPPVAAAAPVVDKVVPIAPGVYERLLQSAGEQRIIQLYREMANKLLKDIRDQFSEQFYADAGSNRISGLESLFTTDSTCSRDVYSSAAVSPPPPSRLQRQRFWHRSRRFKGYDSSRISFP